jgi:hypothetical protein
MARLLEPAFFLLLGLAADGVDGLFCHGGRPRAARRPP